MVMVYYRKRIRIKISQGGVGNSPAVQWLGLRAFIVEDPGSIPGQGTKIPQATWCSLK